MTHSIFSRSLTKSELQHSSVEKEAAAIVVAVCKWNHFLAARHFKLITDQRSISFMFDGKNHGKIKNAKILHWRIEFSQFDYKIMYRAGEFNTAPDVLSQMYCAQISLNQLYEVHSNLCHPGVTQMYHYVCAKNLPYSLDEVRKMTASCKICAEVKPHFYKPPEMHVRGLFKKYPTFLYKAHNTINFASFIQSPSKYSPWWFTHLSQCFCHFSKHFINSSPGML